MSQGLTTKEEIARRRTFAIISHPDAGKTTITEKLIYIGGVIHKAGEVKGKGNAKAATSDWMTMERDRGISITSSVIQFDYNELRVNLLDTPGHKDFSEDTYRTLVAADSALMLIDVAKGVEERTKKLYEVCSFRKIPIFTFVNKCDREGKAPLELMDEIETTLKMRCYPVTWPLGGGGLFTGVYDRLNKKVLLYNGGDYVSHDVDSLKDPRWKDWVHHDIFETVMEDLELVDMDAGEFDHDAFMRGEISPTFFGSAKNNFAVDMFLEHFIKWAPAPGKRKIDNGEVNPLDEKFSGFVFKIQANMDRKHRDRVAFVRVCSGKFSRGMKVQHHRLNRELRLSHATQFVAQDRETVEDAYAGDIVGVGDSGHFQIGDSIASGKAVKFEPIPQFTPELFARIAVADAMKRQKLQKGLRELSEEGAVQLFIDPAIGAQDPVVGVVGELQWEVLMFRLQDEYGLEARLERLPFSVARWPRADDGASVFEVKGVNVVYRDKSDKPVILLNNEWDLNWLLKENANVQFSSPIANMRL